MHEPLSQRLAQIMQANSAPGRATINDLIERTEGRGIYLVIMLLSLPFVVPVSIPGFSTVLGIVIALLCFRLALGLPPRLPKFLGARPLPPDLLKRVLNSSVKLVRFMEKIVRPRRTPWMTHPAARCGNALVMAFMAFLLALPFPPLPPFTNSLPCYSLILLAASIMEEDGVLIWISYGVSIGTILYLTLIGEVLRHAFARIYHTVQQFFM